MNLRSILTSAAFIAMLTIFSAGHLLTPDKDVSVSERRPLEQLPAFSVESLMSGKLTEDLEDYLLDQFPMRDTLRSLKAKWHFNVYKQADNNGIYLAGDHVCKLDSHLKTDEVEAFLTNTNKIYETYLQGMNVSLSVIPDKNYFAAGQNGYPAMDYDKLLEMLSEGLSDGIDFYGMSHFGSLTLDDYYRTDLHWKQESLQGVVDAMAEDMGFTAMDLSAMNETQYSPFYGSYYGQSALRPEPDVLTTLSNELLYGCIVTAPERSGEYSVYEEADFDVMDGYNIYLGGPLGLVTVENPQGTTGKELIMFRDSFASSLVPLLMEGYDKITLIDLRYLASINVGRFVEFTDQDVLFLYNASLINSGKLLK